MKFSPATHPGDSPDNPVRRILADVNLPADVAVLAADRRPAPFVGQNNKPCDAMNWGRIKAAQAGETSLALVALAELCKIYWYPLYAYIRHKGNTPERAEELIQEFFGALLEREFLKSIGREQVKFRSFLLNACQKYMVRQRDQQPVRNQERQRVFLNVDFTTAEARYAREPAHPTTSERLFECFWTMVLLDRVLDQLGKEMRESGQGELFNRLLGAVLGNPEPDSCANLAKELNLSDEAVKAATHQLRRRHRALIREEVRRTVATPGDVDDEIRTLLDSLVP